MKQVFLLLFIPFLLTAQENKKTLNIIRTERAPIINGSLDEKLWQEMPELTDFIQYSPFNGRKSEQKTKAYVTYDDAAFYIGVICYDSSPDSIAGEIGQRDSQDEPYTDLISIHISPYNDGMNSLYFMISASGVQSDRKYNSSGADANWDAVWESDVRITDYGWVAEVKIPCSALRFSSEPVQNWGFNIFRRIARKNEWSSWSFVSIELDKWWFHMGEIKGVNNLNPPVRLSFTPYISGYSEKTRNKNWGYSYNGGIDLKYGISESFTLDMTLIPDFGQVRSDDEELNLSPYELRYDERRQFFTEGTELFEKGDLFYSRRIGATPAGYYAVYSNLNENEEVVENPTEAGLINATKVSGRTSGGLGIATLNAMTGDTFAKVTDRETGEEREILTQGFTNHNITVFDQSFAHNSYLSFINTNVSRKDFMANVAAAETRYSDEKNEYSITGRGAYSYVENNNNSADGFKVWLNGGKVSGEFQFDYELSLISDKYDQNSLGYLDRNNIWGNRLAFQHQVFEPFGLFLKMSNEITILYHRMYNPDAYSDISIHYEIYTTLRDNSKFNMHAAWVPADRNNYNETRTSARYFVNYKYLHNCFSYSTDFRKSFYSSIHGGYTGAYDYQLASSNWSVVLYNRYRFNRQFSISHDFMYLKYINQPGYVSTDQSGNIYFGSFDRETWEQVVSATYIINPEVSFDFRLRHYWSCADYDGFFLLADDGTFQDSDYSENHDINYNAFNVDMTFRWLFAPGSEAVINWKNSIYSSTGEPDSRYWINLQNTLDSPQINSISLKFIYYVDYLNLSAFSI